MVPQSAAVAFPRRTQPATKKDWTLTTEAFELLLKQLHPDRDEAARKYVSLYAKLTRYFEWRGCGMPDQHADETLNRIARRINQGLSVTNFSGFMFGVARKVAIEALREQEKEQQLFSQWSQNEANQDSTDQELLLARLEAGLLKLPPNGRRLLIAYYATGEDKNMKLRRELAKREGISVNALRVRVHRLRLMLESYVKADLANECRPEPITTRDKEARPALVPAMHLLSIA